MSYGDGSIFEIKKPDGKSYNPKRWRICLSYRVEEELEDGTTKTRRKKVQRNYTGTKTGAREFRDQLVAERDENGRLYSEIEAEQKKLEEAKEEITLNTMIPLWDGARRTAGKASERVLKEGVRWLGHVTKHIGDVPLKDITPQMVEATYAAIREERGLSGTSMNHIHQLLKSVFQKAIDYDYIYKNPCAPVVAPRRDDPKRGSLTIEEGARLMGEVDKAEAEAYAQIDEKEARRAYREEHGFDGLKFHELRHTQATQLLANGVDVKTVQTRLGHASASITLGWYAHAIPEKDHEAADLLGAILSGAKPQDNAAEEEEKFPEMSPETEPSRMSPRRSWSREKKAGQPPEKS